MKSSISPGTLNWLQKSENPSIRYRTMVELLGCPENDADVSATKAEIPAGKEVQKILARMHPDGYWLHRGKGEGIDYAMSSSTHFVLAYLAELGMEHSHPLIAWAAERYLSLHQDPKRLIYAGVFNQELQSCLYAYNIRTFILLGYRQDPQVGHWIDLLLDDRRFDGGYLCERTSFTAGTRSCIRGSVKALTAFAEIPEAWDHPSCRELVDYFLRRRVLYQSRNPEKIVRAEMTATIFPFIISAGLLEPLYALSRMGYGRHPALDDAWKILESKLDAHGRTILDYHPSDIAFNPGPKGEVNPWSTLYALLAEKYRQNAAQRF